VIRENYQRLKKRLRQLKIQHILKVSWIENLKFQVLSQRKE